MTASAVLRVGSHAPVILYGTPVAGAVTAQGEIPLLLGYDHLGHEVTLTITSLEWDDDLLQAAADAGAKGFSSAGMRRAVTA